MRWCVSAHPIPDARSVDAGDHALALARGLGPDDLLVVLLSGGASSLMAVPAAGLTLPDKQVTQARLLTAGAGIGDLNIVRKHLSAIKGGRLAEATAARVVTLAASDVVGDDVATIGSGPCAADSSTFGDALRVLRDHGGFNAFPSDVVRYLHAGVEGLHPETPKVLDPARVSTAIVSSLADVLDAAAGAAAALGYRVHVAGRPVVGEAREAGPLVVQEAMRAAVSGAVCVLSGGETTVTVRGRGRGGRNQELALSMVDALAAWPGVVAASLGTDGVDGPTDAAGARVDSTTAARARALGLDPGTYLTDNNSYAFFGALGARIHTGPTGVNAGDIQIVLTSGEHQGWA